jgi:predicted nucleic acid-binding protein
MTTAVFPDNTVLCNFAAIRRVELLAEILRGRGRWVEAVAYEADRSSRYLPDLRLVARDGWLGEPIEIDEPKHAEQVERIRRAVFGGTDSEPTRHLGEAQTIHLIRTTPEFNGSWWVTDDREALDYGRRQGLTVKDTMGLFAEAVAMGELTATEAFQVLTRMRDAGRNLRLPNSASELLR